MFFASHSDDIFYFLHFLYSYSVFFIKRQYMNFPSPDITLILPSCIHEFKILGTFVVIWILPVIIIIIFYIKGPLLFFTLFLTDLGSKKKLFSNRAEITVNHIQIELWLWWCAAQHSGVVTDHIPVSTASSISLCMTAWINPPRVSDI